MPAAIVCPPKNDPAWKKLVEAVGENPAYVAFFRAGHEIPTPEAAKVHLATRPAAYAFAQPTPAPQVAPQIDAAPAEQPIQNQSLGGKDAQRRLTAIDKALADLDKREAKLGPYAKGNREAIADERRALLEERLQRQAELG